MKTNKLAILIMLSFATAFISFNSNKAFFQTSNDIELYPVRVNGKEGYIDATGRVVIKPQFDAAFYYSEGLAKVKNGDKWGFIDKTGRIAINPQFEAAMDFSEGYASVRIGNKEGYIDKTGRIVINPQFDLAYGFSEGLAMIGIGERRPKIGFIDKTGRIVINPQFDWAEDFSEGFSYVTLWVLDQNGNGIGSNTWFIDKTERDVLKQYSPASGFSEGFAFVYYNGRQGCIDKTGQIIFYNQQSYRVHNGYKEGMACVGKVSENDWKTAKYGFVDKTGRFVINLQFDGAADFSEGFACVRIGGAYGNGRYGFVDKTGTYIINPQYNYAESFRGGVAPVIINNQFHYIDKRGNVVWSSSEIPDYITEHISLAEQYDSIY